MFSAHSLGLGGNQFSLVAVWHSTETRPELGLSWSEILYSLELDLAQTYPGLDLYLKFSSNPFMEGEDQYRQLGFVPSRSGSG